MNNNTHILSIVGIVIAVIAVVLSLTGSKEITLKDTSHDQKTISIQGEAERLVAPDTARVTFSMTRKDTNLSQASESVNTRVGEMLADLQEFGVEEKDIKTTNYSVNPEYQYRRESGERVFSGYRVNQSIELTIRDLDKVSSIMTKIASFEVDNVSGLNFYVDQDESIRDELRSEAIKQAQTKAKQLGRELGVNLSNIVGFSENTGGYYPQPVYQSRGLALMDAEEDFAKASIPSGENMMRANVQVTFEIEN